MSVLLVEFKLIAGYDSNHTVGLTHSSEYIMSITTLYHHDESHLFVSLFTFKPANQITNQAGNQRQHATQQLILHPLMRHNSSFPIMWCATIILAWTACSKLLRCFCKCWGYARTLATLLPGGEIKACIKDCSGREGCVSELILRLERDQRFNTVVIYYRISVIWTAPTLRINQTLGDL